MPSLSDDLDHILSDRIFTTCGTFRVSDSKEVCINGDFTEPTDAAVMYGTEIEAQRPTFVVKSSDLTLIKDGMRVEIADVSYIIARQAKVGTGMTVLYLKT
jgi:hypothetical protein